MAVTTFESADKVACGECSIDAYGSMMSWQGDIAGMVQASEVLPSVHYRNFL